MSIDPRIVKQLLQLQFQTGNPFPLQSSASAEAGSEFSLLLQTLMEQAASDGTAETPSTPNPVGPGAGRMMTRTAAPAVPTAAGPAGLYTSALRAFGPSTYAPPIRPTVYDPLVEQASARHGVEASLIKAVIETESSFNRFAVSKAGAKGLMQLMDETGRGLGVADPFDPAQNIDGGTRFLAGLLRKYNGNEAVALAAYNAGPGRVDRLGIRTDADLREKLHLLPRETQRYVSKVLERKETYLSGSTVGLV